MFQAGIKFITEFVSWTAHAGAGGVAALYHEIIDDPVKYHAVIISLAREKDKIIHGLRSLIGKELDHHCPFVGLHTSLIFFLRIDLHGRRGGPLFRHFISLLYL